MSGLTTVRDTPRGQTELAPCFELSVGDYVVASDVARNGQLAVFGSGGGHLVGVDPRSGEERFRVLAHPGGVLGVSIAPDGTQLVTGGQDSDAVIWSAAGERLRTLPGGGPRSAWVDHVAWAPKGGRLATASGKRLRAWTEDGAPLVETADLASTVSALAWREDGTGLAASCYGGVHLFPFVAGARTRHLAWKGSLISLAWSPDAKIVACGSQDCSVHFWRLGSGQDSQMRGYPFKIKTLAWDRESKLLATAGDATITVWDFKGKGPEGTHPLQLALHKAMCTQLAFGAQGHLASGSQDASIAIWQPRRSPKPLRYAFLEDEVTSLAWLPDGRRVLAGDASGLVRAFDVA